MYLYGYLRSRDIYIFSLSSSYTSLKLEGRTDTYCNNNRTKGGPVVKKTCIQFKGFKYVLVTVFY